MPLGMFLCAHRLSDLIAVRHCPSRGRGGEFQGTGTWDLGRDGTHTLNEGSLRSYRDRSDSWDSGDPIPSLLKLPQ